MNNQENDQQHQHPQDGQEEGEQEQEKVAAEEQEKPEAEKEQEKPEAAEDQEKPETAEEQEKLEESEEQEKLEEADNHIMQSSSSTNSQSPPFGSPQLSTIASNHQAYSLHHPQAFKPPKPSSPPPSGTTVEGNTNLGGSKPQDGEVADGTKDQESGGGERRLRTNLSILRRVRRENMKRRALLGFRICGFLFSLVSFSIMAADKNQGWALDSFNRYKEFRYCMAVNVLGFVYSSLQGYDVAYSLAVGKHAVRTQLRCFLDFSIDQILTYLLLSASSSAAFRIEDWESNWGKNDEFPTMAKASVALSFLAFVAFSFCSLVSGYTLFTPNST